MERFLFGPTFEKGENPPEFLMKKQEVFHRKADLAARWRRRLNLP
jgi:hypothetical protein